MTENEDMLARLVAQLADRGGDLVTIRALVEEASEIGAERAMAKLGLADPHARADLHELRGLLEAWRMAKRGMLQSALGWLAKIGLALLLLGLAVRLGLGEWIAR